MQRKPQQPGEMLPASLSGVGEIVHKPTGGYSALRTTNTRLATSQLLNLTWIQLNGWGWHNDIILQCPADLLQIILAAPDPCLLWMQGYCAGNCWKPTQHCPNIVQSSKYVQEYP